MREWKSLYTRYATEGVGGQPCTARYGTTRSVWSGTGGRYDVPYRSRTESLASPISRFSRQPADRPTQLRIIRQAGNDPERLLAKCVKLYIRFRRLPDRQRLASAVRTKQLRLARFMTHQRRRRRRARKSSRLVAVNNMSSELLQAASKLSIGFTLRSFRVFQVFCTAARRPTMQQVSLNAWKISR